MGTLTVIGIAVALAVDAFAVALAAGVTLPRVTWRHTFRLAWHFGLFQAGMTVLGWAAGVSVRSLIQSVDHWLAFGLLAFVGGHMIAEARSPDDERRPSDPTRGRILVMLSVATSIDALAVGLSLAVLHVPIRFPAAVIGVTALLFTAVGLHLGRLARAGSRIGNRVEIGGGLVLIGIGLRILYEHGVFDWLR